MAERPIFLPASEPTRLVEELFLPLRWHSGFAQVQKEKNIHELHASAKAAGLGPLLEVSSKSERTAGKHLSAFHLRINMKSLGTVPLECAFQGSKVFEHGGPYTDLYQADVRSAKRDERLRNSGRIVGFRFEQEEFETEPKTFFYDWLYVNSIYEHRDWLRRLEFYHGFTDIEFNPFRSVNCQARSVALFMTLMKRNLLEHALQSPRIFREVLLEFDYQPQIRENRDTQHALFHQKPLELKLESLV